MCFTGYRPSHPRAEIVLGALSRDKMHLVGPEQLAEITAGARTQHAARSSFRAKTSTPMLRKGPNFHNADRSHPRSRSFHLLSFSLDDVYVAFHTSRKRSHGSHERHLFSLNPSPRWPRETAARVTSDVHAIAVCTWVLTHLKFTLVP